MGILLLRRTDVVFWRSGVSTLNQSVVEAQVTQVGFNFGWKLQELVVVVLMLVPKRADG